MPIDPNIPMSFRSPRVTGPMDMAGKAMTIKNMSRQGELLDTQLSGQKFANKSARTRFQLEQTNRILLSAQAAGTPEALQVAKNEILSLAGDETERANAMKLVDSLDQPGGLDFAIMSTSDVDKLLEYGNAGKFDDYVLSLNGQTTQPQAASPASNAPATGAPDFSGQSPNQPGPIISQDPAVKQMEAVASAPLTPSEEQMLQQPGATGPEPAAPAGGPQIAAATGSKPPRQMSRVEGMIMKEISDLERERQMTLDYIKNNRGRVPPKVHASLKALETRKDKLHDQLIKESEGDVQTKKAMDVGNGYVQDKISYDGGLTWEPFPGGKPYLRKDATGGNVTVEVDLGKKAQNDVDTALLNALAIKQQMHTIRSSYRPEYTEIATRANMAILRGREKLGNKLDPEEKRQLKQFHDWKVNSLGALNAYIKAMTGAALSEAEAKRLRAAFPDAGEGIFDGMGATEFESALDSVTKQFRQVEAKAHYIKKHGLSVDQVDFEDMPRIINQRGAELERQLAAQGVKAEELQGRVREALATEFGLIY